VDYYEKTISSLGKRLHNLGKSLEGQVTLEANLLRSNFYEYDLYELAYAIIQIGTL